MRNYSAQRLITATFLGFLLIASAALAIDVDSDVFGTYQSDAGTMRLIMDPTGGYTLSRVGSGDLGRIGTISAVAGRFAFHPAAGDGPDEEGSYQFQDPMTLVITTNYQGTVVWHRMSPPPSDFSYGQHANDPRAAVPCPSGGCSAGGSAGAYPSYGTPPSAPPSGGTAGAAAGILGSLFGGGSQPAAPTGMPAAPSAGPNASGGILGSLLGGVGGQPAVPGGTAPGAANADPAAAAGGILAGMLSNAASQHPEAQQLLNGLGNALVQQQSPNYGGGMPQEPLPPNTFHY
jgi:hypothetical protein